MLKLMTLSSLIKMLIGTLILLLGIPTGWLIASLAEDELKEGKKWFLGLSLITFILAAWFLLTKNYEWMYNFLFMSIVSFVSYEKAIKK